MPSCAPASPYERPKFRHRTCLAMVSPSKQPLARRLCWEGFLPGSVKMFPSYPICRRGTSSPPHLSSHSSSLRLVCHSLNFALFRFRSGSKSWSLVTLRSVGLMFLPMTCWGFDVDGMHARSTPGFLAWLSGLAVKAPTHCPCITIAIHNQAKHVLPTGS